MQNRKTDSNGDRKTDETAKVQVDLCHSQSYAIGYLFMDWQSYVFLENEHISEKYLRENTPNF